MKTYKYIEDVMESLEERARNRFFLFRWIDEKFLSGGLFGYRASYVLLRPHVAIREILSEIKYAYQRVFRGWDDRVVWGVDSWLNDIMPEILNRLKKNKCGVPGRMLVGVTPGDNHEYSEEQLRVAQENWQNELDKIIEGFIAAKKLCDLDYDWRNKKEERKLKNIFRDGMDSFRDNYSDLYD